MDTLKHKWMLKRNKTINLGSITHFSIMQPQSCVRFQSSSTENYVECLCDTVWLDCEMSYLLSNGNARKKEIHVIFRLSDWVTSKIRRILHYDTLCLWINISSCAHYGSPSLHFSTPSRRPSGLESVQKEETAHSRYKLPIQGNHCDRDLVKQQKLTSTTVIIILI